MIGTDDVQTAASVVSELEDLEKLLADDIAKGKVHHFWNYDSAQCEKQSAGTPRRHTDETHR